MPFLHKYIRQGLEMLSGLMLLWFLSAAIALVFVIVDMRPTPESPLSRRRTALNVLPLLQISPHLVPGIRSSR